MRKILSGIAMAFALGQLPAQAATALTPQQYHELLLNLSVQPGNSADAAVAEIRRRTNNSDPEAQLNLGRALASFKAYPDSIEVLTRATELAPTSGVAFGWLGFSAFWAGNCDVSIPALERALVLTATPQGPGKESSYWHSLAGRCALRKGEFPSAIEHCKTAASLAPADPRGEFCLAKAYFGLRNFEAALAIFTKTTFRSDLGQFEIPYKERSQSFAILALHELGRLDQASTLLRLEPKQWPRERLLQVAEWENKVEQNNLRPWSWQE